MDASSTKAEVAKKLNQLARETSISRLESICKHKGFSLDERPQLRRVKDHWMAQALISGPQLRAIFCVYYNAQNLKKWSSGVFGKDWTEIALAEVQDLSKEFCNLVAGHLKAVLDQNNVKVGVSLPFLSRGSDRIFSPIDSESSIHKDSWRITTESSFITCSTSIEIFKEFSFEVKSTIDDTGEVEFL